MLKKLIKHEFRATGRIMWPAFAGMLVLSLAMRLAQAVLTSPDSLWLLDDISMIVTVIFVFGLIAMCLAPMVLSAARFRSHVLSDEGYLTLTLPVSMHQLLASKLLVSAVWYAAAFVLFALAIGLVVLSVSDWNTILRGAVDVFRVLFAQTSVPMLDVVLCCIELLLVCVLAVTVLSLMLYAGFAVGYSFDHHKRLMTVAACIVFFWLTQLWSVTGLMRLGGGVLGEELTGLQTMELAYAFTILGELVCCAVFYAVTWYFTTKKLNLE